MLHDLYINLGFEILIIPPAKGLPDLVFTTDHGKWIGDTFYLSRFRYAEREREQAISVPWYKSQKIKTVSLPTGLYMEGGDILTMDNTLYIGHGYRTSEDTTNYLGQATGLATIPLHLIDDAFYHLDTCFLPLTPDTACYYPPAFDTESIKNLKKSFPVLIPLSSHEAESFVCNSVIIGHTILTQPCPSFELTLLDLGFSPITLEMHEFNKSGGGIHCLSQILD
jgi:N-dimethylarginine dimethylaminohydrolase